LFIVVPLLSGTRLVELGKLEGRKLAYSSMESRPESNPVKQLKTYLMYTMFPAHRSLIVGVTKGRWAQLSRNWGLHMLQQRKILLAYTLEVSLVLNVGSVHRGTPLPDFLISPLYIIFLEFFLPKFEFMTLI
jgi:hypothetical protein